MFRLVLILIILTPSCIPFLVPGSAGGDVLEAEVLVRAVPDVLPEAPTNFVVEATSSDSISMTWTKGVGATTTVIVANSGSYPDNVSDGVVVYNGAAESSTYSNLGLDLDEEAIYLRAWSHNDFGYSIDFAEASVGGGILLVLGFLGLAGFFTWFSDKRKNILLTLCACLIWFSMSMWLFFASEPAMGIDESWQQILAVVFFVLAFVPLLLQMDTEIKREKDGRAWTEWGKRPKDHPMSSAEAYRKELRRRIRKYY